MKFLLLLLKDFGENLTKKKTTFLTPAGKVTYELSTLIFLKMAELSKAKSAKQSFASNCKKFEIF